MIRRLVSRRLAAVCMRAGSWNMLRRRRRDKRMLERGKIRGGVDGILQGEMRGWIAEPEHIVTPAIVRCIDASGRSLEFRATYRRDDLCRMFELDNVRGFAIPIDLLRTLGAAFTVQDGTGSVLRNGTIKSVRKRQPERSAADIERRCLIFIHIPKTGGTSLRNKICQEMSPGERLLVYSGDNVGVSEADFAAMPRVQRSRFRLIYGHLRFGLHRHLDMEVRYATFIRDPLARLRSNIIHHIVQGTTFDLGYGEVSLSRAVNEGLSDEFDNLMTRVISGLSFEHVGREQINEQHVDLAITNIRRYFSFVGHQKRMAADGVTFQRLMSLPTTEMGFDNVTPGEKEWASEKLAEVDWAAVALRNRFDLMLHDELERLQLSSRILNP